MPIAKFTKYFRLVPWSSGNKTPKHEKEDDLTIPVRATILSTVSFILVCALTPLVTLTFGRSDSDNYIWFFVTVTSVVFNTMPVLMLCLTVKQHQKLKTLSVQPPQGLQFHDNSELEQSFEDGSEMVTVTADDEPFRPFSISVQLPHSTAVIDVNYKCTSM